MVISLMISQSHEDKKTVLATIGQLSLRDYTVAPDQARPRSYQGRQYVCIAVILRQYV
jgi:hypothetical protein